MQVVDNSRSLLLTVPEAATSLRLSKSLVYQMILRGKFPCVRIGRAVRVPHDAMIEWLNEQQSTRTVAQNSNDNMATIIRGQR
jgi:excisionase family DNA binding protein